MRFREKRGMRVWLNHVFFYFCVCLHDFDQKDQYNIQTGNFYIRKSNLVDTMNGSLFEFFNSFPNH